MLCNLVHFFNYIFNQSTLYLYFPGGYLPHPPLDPLDELVADSFGKNKVSAKGVKGAPKLHRNPAKERSSRYCALISSIGNQILPVFSNSYQRLSLSRPPVNDEIKF